MKHLSRTLKEHQLDICGENGEYHTLVIDGPLFKKEAHNYYTSELMKVLMLIPDY